MFIDDYRLLEKCLIVSFTSLSSELHALHSRLSCTITLDEEVSCRDELSTVLLNLFDNINCLVDINAELDYDLSKILEKDREIFAKPASEVDDG